MAYLEGDGPSPEEIEKVLKELDKVGGEYPETEPGQLCEQRDAAILRSLPGVGRIVLATLLAEAHQAVQARDYPRFANADRCGAGHQAQRQVAACRDAAGLRCRRGSGWNSGVV